MPSFACAIFGAVGFDTAAQSNIAARGHEHKPKTFFGNCNIFCALWTSRLLSAESSKYMMRTGKILLYNFKKIFCFE
jgi:hypothetical protein